MESEKKICPLSMSCPEDIPLCPCQKQRCAWWDEDSQDCAAVALARAMITIVVRAVPEWYGTRTKSTIYTLRRRN